MCTADRSPIECWGVRKMPVAAGGRRFTWDFLLADVALPIIGVDFLWRFGLLVDLGEMRLLARKGGWSKHLVELTGGGMGGCRSAPPSALRYVLVRHAGT